MEIYAIYDTREPERIRYVGMTKVGAERRLRGHWKDSRRGLKRPLALWLAKRTSGDVGLRVLESCVTLEDLYESEVKWIAHYRKLGMCDLNITNGGGGVPGHKHSPEFKKKVSQRASASKGTYRHTEETKALMREIGKQKFSTPELLEAHAERVAKLTRAQVAEIKKRLWLGQSQSQIAREFESTFQNVSNISRGVSWKHVPWPIGPRPRFKQENVARGQSSGNSKLTDADVLQIRAVAGLVSNVEIARRFAISPASVCNIVKRKTWKHLP